MPDDLISGKKRKTLSLKLKRDIIKDFEMGMKNCQIARKLNLQYSTVSSIVKDKKRILEAVESEQTLNTSLIRRRHRIIAEMETLLKVWCENRKTLHLHQGVICKKARQIFDKLKKNANDDEKNVTFVASNGWFRRFKKRCNWKNNVQSEAGSSTDPASSFSTKLHELIIAEGYSAQTVFNVKEAGLFWKKMPIEENKMEKDKLMVMLGSNAAGDCRLKPLLVYHCENPKALKHKAKSGLPVIWKFNPETTVTASLFEDWFGHHFIPEAERYCNSQNLPFRVMLVLDDAPEHSPATLVDFDPRIKVVFLPPNATGLRQPMDEGVVKTFRANYTRRFFAHLTEAMIQKEKPFVEIFSKNFNLLDSVRIIGESWAEISDHVLRVAWGNLCPYFVQELDTTQEPEPVDQAIRDVITLAKHMNLEVNQEEIYQLLESHDEKRLADVKKETEIEDDDSQPEKLMTVEKLTESIDLIESGIRILEEIDSNEVRVMTARQNIQRSIACYVDILREKKSFFAQ